MSQRFALAIALLLLVDVSRPAQAAGIVRRCVRGIASFVHERTFGLGIRTAWNLQTTQHEENGPVVDLFSISPSFSWVLSSYQVFLVESHSKVRIYKRDGKFFAQVPVKGGVFEEPLTLDSDETALFQGMDGSIYDLPNTRQPELVKLFQQKISPFLFRHAEKSISEVSAAALNSVHLHGASKWSIQRNGRLVGYQIESKAYANGRIAPYNSSFDREAHWSIRQILIHAGVAEVRWYPTQNENGRFRFLRFPLANLLNTHGDLERSLESSLVFDFALSLEEQALLPEMEYGSVSALISRAQDIGMDPFDGFEPIKYLNRVVFFRQGHWAGRLGHVIQTLEGNNNMATGGGNRCNLGVILPDTAVSFAYPNSNLSLIEMELITRGIDPITHEPLVYANGDSVRLLKRGDDLKFYAGESVRVVTSQHQRVLVEQDSTGGEKSERWVSIFELMPERYFHSELFPFQPAPILQR